MPDHSSATTAAVSGPVIPLSNLHQRGSAPITSPYVGQIRTIAATTVKCMRRRDTKRSGIVGIAATTFATMGQKRTTSTCITPNMYQALVRLILITLLKQGWSGYTL